MANSSPGRYCPSSSSRSPGSTINAQRLPLLSVAIVSAAALGYEVLLMRLFSIIQWHHFAYMMISLALLGFGASGALLTVLQRPLLQRFAVSYMGNLVLFGITAVGGFLLAQRLPFNAEEVLWDARQTIWLLCTYLLLTLPFFFAANAIGLALIQYRARLSRIYAADLLGAGVGSLGILALLYVLQPLQALTALGLLGPVAALVAGLELRQRPSAAWLLLPLAAAGLLLIPGDWNTLNISPYKGLSQTLRVKDTRVIAERSSPLGLLSVVESPTIPLRHAPGLSLNARTEPPSQLGIFTDADSLSVITRYNGERRTLAHLDQLTSALPYHLRPVRRALILGAGGGADVLQALYHRAAHIDAVELNPQLARLVNTDYADFAGHLYQLPGVNLHIAEARSFTAASPGDYDLIQVSLLDSFSASASGQFALSENHLYTVEGLAGFVQKLAPGGLLSITRWIKLPPRDTLKLFATAVASLRAGGVTDPGQRLVLIRGWQTGTLLVKNGAVTREEINRLREFCAARAFDLAWYPGITRAESNHYNRLRQPWFYDAARALLGDDAERFLDDYKFNLRPATDDQPYFFHFFKWSTLAEVMQLRTRGGAPLADAGYLVLVATLGQAVIASLVLILLPLFIYRRHNRGQPRTVSRARVMGYFFILGLAFLFIEIAFIQKLLLFLHHPLYTIAVVLSSFLVFSGLGSAWLGRVPGVDRGRLQVRAVIGIVTLGTLYLLLAGSLPGQPGSLPDAVRILASITLIAPLAFCMGMPFPLGLGQLADRAPGLIPWAWAINGCASVISAVLATLLAIHAGFSFVIAVALVLYALSLWVFPGRGGVQGLVHQPFAHAMRSCNNRLSRRSGPRPRIAPAWNRLHRHAITAPMKAIHMTATGPADEVLQTVEVPEPEITAPGQIKVQIKAAGVNPVDTKLRSRGVFYPDALPAILGCDAAGIITETGADVKRFQPGDAVWFCHGGLGGAPGNYAQYTVLDEAEAGAKPAGLDFAEAAALPLVLITAWEALFDRARLAAGQTVLIHAGAGGVGHVAIQLAHATGAKVATTVGSSEKAGIAARFGADKTILYHDEDIQAAIMDWTGGRGVDVVLDTVGGETFRNSLELAAVYGQVVTLLDPGNDVSWGTARSRNLGIHFTLMLTPMLQDLPGARRHQGEILDRGAELVAAGKLKPLLTRTLPLEEATSAHQLIEAGHMSGKLVLIP